MLTYSIACAITDFIVKYFRLQYNTHSIIQTSGTVVGAKPCVRCPLEVKGKGIRGVGGVADKEAYTVHTINIIVLINSQAKQ
jgi:hypothetical protein